MGISEEHNPPISLDFCSHSGHEKSLVHGFISDDGVFEGKIHVGNDEYFVESAKQYFKDSPQDFHSVIYERKDVHYPHAYGPGVKEKTKRWMDEVKRYEAWHHFH